MISEAGVQREIRIRGWLLHLGDRQGMIDSRTGQRVEYPEGSRVDAEPFALNDNAAQQLMNSLWNAGIRPENGTGGPAQAEAMQGHLADLRAIAFHVLKMERS